MGLGFVSLLAVGVAACGDKGGASATAPMGDTSGEVNEPATPATPGEDGETMTPSPGGDPAATPEPVDGEPAMNPDAIPEAEASPDDVEDPTAPEPAEDPTGPIAVDDTDHNEFTRLTRDEYRATVLSALPISTRISRA